MAKSWAPRLCRLPKLNRLNQKNYINKMKKTITKPEVKVMKLQKMNVIATSGEVPVTGFNATMSTSRGQKMEGEKAWKFN